MRKSKRIISLILVLTMILSIFSIGIIQTSAAVNEENYQNPPYEPALLGDIDRNGRIDGNDVFVLSALSQKEKDISDMIRSPKILSITK